MPSLSEFRVATVSAGKVPRLVDCLIERVGPGKAYPFRKAATGGKRPLSDCSYPYTCARVATYHSQTKLVASTRDDKQETQQSDHSSTSSTVDCQDSFENQAEPDLLYLDILNEAVEDNAESRGSRSLLTTPDTRSNTAKSQQRALYSHLNDVDNDYLVRKGVYALPHPQQLDALIKTYFDYVYPHVPIINRTDFIRQYQSGHCSLFLLYAILTPATLNAPMDVLSACGFLSRSEAQESFFSKARLLHDFATEGDPLLMLQGSVALCMVIPDHPTDKDFGYWFYSAVRIATKLDIRRTCIREDKSRKIIQLYRRIWWALYSLDIFHVFASTKHTQLLEYSPKIKPRREDDWETDDLSLESSGLLTAMSPQQKALSVVHCELSQIFTECLSTVINKPQQNPGQLLVSLDIWRKALPLKLHVGNNIGTDIYYLNIQAISYRYECSLCRLIRHGLETSSHDNWTDWANQRLRLAILELDTIVMRVLASGTLQRFPIFFITTITMLLALHIKATLDPNETDLTCSMSRISISQTMLILSQGKDIPALKRALPIFEEILAKKKLYWTVPKHDQMVTQIQLQQDAHEQVTGVGNSHRAAEGDPVRQMHSIDFELESTPGLQQQQLVADVSFDTDSLGFDFLYDWPVEQF